MSPSLNVFAEANSSSYKTGYKCPPKDRQFKPGKSGNPKGRPKGARGFNSLVREIMTEKVTVRTPKGVRNISKAQAALLKLAEKAFGGDIRALSALFAFYRQAVPDDQASSIARSAGQIEQENAALAALFTLVRDEVLSSKEEDAV